ncbi:AAA family ATPase [Haloflavibacter putidus]|uniref:ATP-binding protein n=1 Tax=Haloflavibacter putidus TaxID=2576776 RepID=A0A507ZTV1_9FLAO|nr:ATP-binding protein [Haloflavibacter putidus]TQD39168.1 ATP-binding protein [Haloflavibacter putidus]
MQTEKILIIGGPGTGKSTALSYLKAKGYLCFPEISREVTKEAQRKGVKQLFLDKPLLFSEKLLEGRIKQFKEADESNQKFIFIDRGIPDVTAYMDYHQDDYPSFFTEANKEYRYSKVFLFPIWEEIYASDNERYESLEEAKIIQNHLIKTYENLDYKLIKVPKASVEKRVNFILDKLKNS